MKRFLKFLIALVAGLGINFLMVLLLLNSCDDLCQNQIKMRQLSPNRELKAVVFVRDCGATTSFSSQIAILESSEKLTSRDGGNIYIVDEQLDNLKVKWLNNKKLLIETPKVSERKIFEQKRLFKGVEIEYRIIN